MGHHKDSESDLERIKSLIEVMKAEGLVELEIKHGDDKILLKRSSGQQIISAVPMMAGGSGGAVPAMAGQAEQGGAEQAEEDTNLEIIKSPIVGTFYSAPSPDSEPFVEAGSKVEEKTVVCIIEAMKVMNEIKSEMSGAIVEILVKNGESVEYGQGLFKVKPE